MNSTVMSESHTQDGSHEAAVKTLVDVTRRRLATIERQSALPAEGRFANWLIEGVYAVILMVTVGLWAILGFVVWVPLLVRTTTLLAGTLFYVSLFRDQTRAAHAQKQVHFAARFYARGFDHFFAFYRQRGESEAPAGLFEPLTAMTRATLLVACVWVVTVWMVTVFTVNATASALFGG